MARRLPEPEEHPNHERWLISYADFITLLFAFFVVMYSISSVNEGKFRVLSESLVASFRSPLKSLDPIQVGELARSTHVPDSELARVPAVVTPPLPPRPEKESSGDSQEERLTEEQKQNMIRISEQIQESMKPLIDSDLIDVKRTELWVEVAIKSSILFPSGSARLSPEAIPTLERIAAILVPLPNTIDVEGFTDNVPISTPIYPSNWELSAARAASVVHLFVEKGVDPLRLAAIGYGEYHPVADNSTPEGRSRNRRVVLVIHGARDKRRVAQVVRKNERQESPPPEPAWDSDFPATGDL